MAHATTRVRRCYLVRHAIAEARGAAWPDDTQRPLSAEGVRRMKRAVRGLVALDVELDVIVSSPLVRARQTAEILSRGLRGRPDVIELPELAPGLAPATTARSLAAATDAASLAIVGHEPDLGSMAAWLVGATQPIAFKKGAICRIDVSRWPPQPHSRLIWFATPKMLRSIT